MHSEDPDSDERESTGVSRLRRRSFLAASGALGASTLFGVGRATPGDGTANRTGSVRSSVPEGAFTRHELTANGLGNAQTDTPPFSPRLTTHDGRQYYAYWTHGGELVVAARDLPDGEWVQNNTGVRIDERNGHWTPAVGVGPDGHVFLCYNTRDSVVRWRRSTNPADVTAFGDERVGMTGQNESSVTYVEFTRLLDGTLLVGFRNGASGAGDWIMNRWNADGGEWEPLQHPLVDGAWEGNEYNSYMWNLVQSEDGTLHYFFCWRETWDVQTNGDLSYARSTDGGETWERSDGTAYDLPITYGSAETVDPIPENSNLINQGWASYDPRNGAPHVAYYRDDEDDNTQVFHAYLDDGEWVTEPATDRASNINLGGGGVVASPIGRMGIVVDDDGDVHILTRDFENGSWPLLVEKLDGEWQTSVLYKRNVTWSDVHIDRERWREDRVLSFVDHQQNVGDVPWSAHSLVGITDVDFEELDRTNRGISLSGDQPDELATYVSTDAVNPPVSTTSAGFEDTDTALAFTETTVPATPVYVRASVTLDAPDDAEAAARVKVQGEHGTTHGDPVSVADGKATRTTDWTKVPQAFRAGFANVQIAGGEGDASAELVDATLEVGYDDPTPHENTVAPHGGEKR